MRRPQGDSGDTLVEILVALAVLGIGIVALTGALTTNVTTTGLNRQQAQAESVLTSAAEHVKGLATAPACGAVVTAPTVSEVPRSADYAVSYGPAEAVEGQPCAEVVAVPVKVTGNGFNLSVTVVKRP
jgi:type II secretory pathway pseudopilin PulG